MTNEHTASETPAVRQAPMDAEAGELLRSTRRGELVRASCFESIRGALAGSGLSMAVALQFYRGADWQKGLIACVVSSGFVLSPFVVSIVARFGFRVSRATAVITATN